MAVTAAEIRARYRAEAMAWAAAQGDPMKANRLFKRHHAFYKKVRVLAEGREALESLLADDEPAVRLLAATHLLPARPELAEPVLRELEGQGGAYAMDAKVTLLSFRAGKLDLDW